MHSVCFNLLILYPVCILIYSHIYLILLIIVIIIIVFLLFCYYDDDDYYYCIITIMFSFLSEFTANVLFF